MAKVIGYSCIGITHLLVEALHHLAEVNGHEKNCENLILDKWFIVPLKNLIVPLGGVEWWTANVLICWLIAHRLWFLRVKLLEVLNKLKKNFLSVVSD